MEQLEDPEHDFVAWERRTRGWQVWPRVVDLEPPFRPVQLVEPERSFVDDSLRPRFWNRALGKDFFAQAPVPTPVVIEEPEPRTYTNQQDLYEFVVLLPAELQVWPNVVREFLLNLQNFDNPVSFEVIGNSEKVQAQFTCREDDRDALKANLAAFFPDVRVEKGDLELYYEITGALQQAEASFCSYDFGLSSPFLRRIEQSQGFALDPLISVIGFLDTLKEDQMGVVQVLFQPVVNNWETEIYQVAHLVNDKTFTDYAYGKVTAPLFAVTARVAVVAQSWHTNDLARALGRAFATSVSSEFNELMALSDDGYEDDARLKDILERTSCRSGMLLNVDELVTLVHPPSASVRSTKLRRLRETTTKGAPEIAVAHEGLVIGTNEHEGRRKKIALSPEQRMRHMYVIGASGTGKSTLLVNCIMQDIEAGRGLAVLDPHGDLIDDILARIPENRINDVVLLDPSDEQYSVGLNVLSAKSELERILLASDLVETFRRLSTSWGDRMNSILANTIMAMLESTRGGTLLDMRRFLVDDRFRAVFLESVTDTEIVYFWKNEYPMLKGNVEAPILTRLDIFLRPKPIRYMVAQKNTSLDFSDVMNSGKIFLGKLSQGAIGSENSYLLGSILVTKFQQAAMSRQAIAKEDRRDFYLYIDEFHNFITPSLAELLSGVRKYRMGLILAHQELRQTFKDSDVASAILANPYTRICFRVSDSDAKKLAEGLSFFEAKDLQNLSTGEAIARLERSSNDFRLDTLPAPAIDRADAERRITSATNASRAKYAHPKIELDHLFAHLNEEPQEKPAKKSRAKAEGDPAPEVVEAAPFKPSKAQAPPVAQAPGPIPFVEDEEVDVLETTESIPAPIPKKAPKLPASEALPGRGGREHKRIQSQIKHWGLDKGYNATIEKGLPQGAGSVDVALENGDFKIACEISITTSVGHEVGNVEKCLGAGFDKVVLVLGDQRALGRANVALDKLDPAAREKVICILQSDIYATLETLDANKGGGKTSHGYGVKVTMKPQKETDLQNAKSKILKAMLGFNRDKKK